MAAAIANLTPPSAPLGFSVLALSSILAVVEPAAHSAVGPRENNVSVMEQDDASVEYMQEYET